MEKLQVNSDQKFAYELLEDVSDRSNYSPVPNGLVPDKIHKSKRKVKLKRKRMKEKDIYKIHKNDSGVLKLSVWRNSNGYISSSDGEIELPNPEKIVQPRFKNFSTLPKPEQLPEFQGVKFELEKSMIGRLFTENYLNKPDTMDMMIFY